MRRVRWQTNDGAVALVLVGVLVLAAALSLYGTGGSPNDVVGCPSLAAVDRPGPDLFLTCSAFRDDRAHFVRELGVAGLVVVVLGLLTARRRWAYQAEDLEPSWSAVLWCVAPPVVIVVLTIATVPGGQANDGVVTALGQVYVAGGVFLAWYGASLLRDALTRAHLLVGAAVAVPLACAATAAVEAARWPSPTGAQEADFPYLEPWSPALLSLAATGVLFAGADAVAKAGRPAPNVWVGGLLFAASTAATLPVFVTDLVPAWHNVDAYDYDGPGTSVWLPILLAPAALAVVVWGACAARRVHVDALSPAA